MPIIILFAIGMSGVPVYGEDVVTVAVMNLDARNVGKSDAVIITGFIRESLVKTDKFKVLERESMEEILREQRFQLTGCTSQECAVKTGKLLNVRQMVVGSLSKLGSKYYISVRLVDVQDSTILMAETAECFSTDELRNAAEIIGVKLAGMTAPSLPEEGGLSPYDKDRLNRILNILYVQRKYYRREVRNSWIVTGLGLILGIGGVALFEGNDRLVFAGLGGVLAVAGPVSVNKNYDLLREIKQDINVTLVRINLAF